jgi:predicted nucleic acid-binding protein
VILPDTSAWVEYFRATGSATHVRVRALVGSQRVATTGPVVMELLAGTPTDSDRVRVRRMAAACEWLPAGDPDDYLQAAAIYRACRRGGENIRATIECVIAAVAIRAGAEVLHHNRDFDAIARHAPLAVA